MPSIPDKDVSRITDLVKSLPAWKNIPLTISLDIRRNEYKYTVIDANIFPSGHNNILDDRMAASASGFKQYLQSIGINQGPVAIYPEFMTKNRFYGDNLTRIMEICVQAGYEPLLYWPKDLEGPYNHEGEIPKHPDALERCKFVWLNNDLSGGMPEELKELTVPVLPNPDLGWYTRKKSNFFERFNEVLMYLENKLDVDLNYMKIKHRVVEVKDLFNDEDLRKMHDAVHSLSQEIKVTEKYRSSFFIKNNHGTFGLGVLGIEKPEDVLTLNMRKRQNLSLSKDKSGNSEYLVQEGVPSGLTENNNTCEEILMGIGGTLITRFMRCHDTKTPYDSLNAKGMKLVPSTLSICQASECVLFHVSLLAASLELTNERL